MWRINSLHHRLLVSSTRCSFSTSVVALRRVDRLRTPNFSSLNKHRAPSHLTGYQLRKKAREEQKYSKTPVSEKTRGFIPVRFKLQPVVSDVVKPKNNSKSITKNVNNLKKADTKTLATIEHGKSVEQGKAFEALTTLHPELHNGLTMLLRDAGTLADDATPRPTPIQSLALPILLKQTDNEPRDMLLAAETGTGKTLAYLLPLINSLKMEELAANSDKQRSVRRIGCPRTIILAPSRHLVDQTLAVAKKLSHYCKFRAIAVTRGAPSVRQAFDQPIDVVIGTPKAVADMLRQQVFTLKKCQWLVFDEADTLFDKDFYKECRYLVETLRNGDNADVDQVDAFATDKPAVPAVPAELATPSTGTILLVAATVPKAVMDRLPELMPNLVRVATPELHRARRRLHQNFVDIKQFGSSRNAALVSTLNQFGEVTMIFCNRRETCDTVHAMLKERGIASALFHGGDINAAHMTEMIGGQRTLRAIRKAKEAKQAELATNNTKSGPAPVTTSTTASLPDVIICTDLAARGLDTTRVRHVILYDFPTTVVDYLHRIGRTGRANQKGHVTALIGKKDRQLADRVRRCVRDHAILS